MFFFDDIKGNIFIYELSFDNIYAFYQTVHISLLSTIKKHLKQQIIRKTQQKIAIR